MAPWTSGILTYPHISTYTICVLLWAHNIANLLPLPFGLFAAPQVFTKVPAPILTLLHCPIKGPAPSNPVSQSHRKVQTLQSFRWILHFQKLPMNPTPHLAYLYLILDTALSRPLLPRNKFLPSARMLGLFGPRSDSGLLQGSTAFPFSLQIVAAQSGSKVKGLFTLKDKLSHFLVECRVEDVKCSSSFSLSPSTPPSL